MDFGEKRGEKGSKRGVVAEGDSKIAEFVDDRDHCPGRVRGVVKGRFGVEPSRFGVGDTKPSGNSKGLENSVGPREHIQVSVSECQIIGKGKEEGKTRREGVEDEIIDNIKKEGREWGALGDAGGDMDREGWGVGDGCEKGGGGEEVREEVNERGG